jgi:hypothetical protein
MPTEGDFFLSKSGCGFLEIKTFSKETGEGRRWKGQRQPTGRFWALRLDESGSKMKSVLVRSVDYFR